MFLDTIPQEGDYPRLKNLLRPFFGYARPAFRYEELTAAMPQPVAIPVPDKVTLLLPKEMGLKGSDKIKTGTRIRTGQVLTWDEKPGPAVVSSVTGTITSVAGVTGDYGRKYTAITVAPEKEDEWEEQPVLSTEEPNLENLIACLAGTPGGAGLASLAEGKKPVHTIVVLGADTDLLVETGLYVLKSRIEDVDRGLAILKKATGVEKIILAVPGESLQNVDGHFNAEVMKVSADYPAGQPLMIFYHLMGRVLAQGESYEDAGLTFIKAETVAAIGRALNDGRVPVEKILTVLDKQGRRRLASARIGTPVGSVLDRLGIALDNNDRLICGGPMTGSALYSGDQPVTAETDALLVQASADVILTSDYPCINCGDCIRSCPARVPMNMLIRFLEAGQYQEGADLYDLYSCVECGLCSLVCPSRKPILQYVKLAKFELQRRIAAEEQNG